MTLKKEGAASQKNSELNQLIKIVYYNLSDVRLRNGPSVLSVTHH